MLLRVILFHWPCRVVAVRMAALAVLSMAAVSSAWAKDCAVFNQLPRAVEGRLGYDRTSKNIYFCNGTAWTRIGSTATSTPVIPIPAPNPPATPSCLAGLIYRTGTGCCVSLASQLITLQIRYGLVLQLCPALL